ncbi:MAG TPA: hypothetical protein VN408_22565 [Actinoplanes sp.]|nr:hypothetical protein [Actinoplanes sp.]
MYEISVLFRSEPTATSGATPAVADRSREAMQRLRQPFAVGGMARGMDGHTR